MMVMVMLLAAPMQSWGERAAFSQRDTLPHPTRSGVIGMLGCALGRGRQDDLGWAAPLTVHVRADTPGQVMTDYHTVGGGYAPERAMITASGTGRRTNSGRGTAMLTRRAYLSDAAFTITVAAGDSALIEQLHDAVRAPRWPLFLGRKSCPPALPPTLGVTSAEADVVLGSLPAYTRHPVGGRGDRPFASRLTAPSPGGTAPQTDWFAEVADAAGQEPTIEQQTTPLDASTVERTIYLDGVAAVDAYTVTRDDPVSIDPLRREYRTRNVGADLVAVPAAGTGVAAWCAMRDALQDLT